MNYGWVIVGALLGITALTIPLAGPIMGFFIPAMHADLGIPMALFGWAVSARQLAFAFAAPWLGRWIDRHGARGLLIAIGLISGVLVYLLGHVTSGWQLLLCIGLLGVIGLQGGGGDLFSGVVIAKWFQENRGRAMSIAFIGMPLGIFIASPAAEYLIAQYGWRSAWQTFAIVSASGFVGFAFLIRNPPPIGNPVIEKPVEADPSVFLSGYQWSRAEALRSGAFWRVAICFGILMFTISTVAIFRVPHFIEQGVNARWVALAFSAEAVVSAVVAIPVGLMLERFPTHYLAGAGFCIAILMLLLTIFADSRIMVFAATMTFGFGAASVVIIQNAIWPAYFGVQNIGAIRGAAMPVTLSFAVLGAPVAGMVKDATGSFVPLWWITIGAMVVAILLMLSTPRPVGPVPEND